MKYGIHDSITAGQVKRESLGGHDTRTLAKVFVQQMPRPVQPGLGRFFSDAQTCCGFCPAEAFDCTKHEDRSVTVRQRIDCLFQHQPQLMVVCLPLRITRPCLRIVHNMQVCV